MAIRQQPKPLHLTQPEQFHIGIVKAGFNEDITNQQLQTALNCLQEYSISYDIVEVAGCYEMPYMLKKLSTSQKQKYTALVALGCLIKGDTIHFEIIAESVARGIMDISIQQEIPIGFGVITAFTHQQAQDRIYIGYDAVYAVLQSLH